MAAKRTQRLSRAEQPPLLLSAEVVLYNALADLRALYEYSFS